MKMKNTLENTLKKAFYALGLVAALAACGENGKDYTDKVSCTKDSECKGDRVCDSELGYCVDANGSSSASSSSSSSSSGSSTSSSASSASSSSSSTSSSSSSSSNSSSSSSGGYVHPLVGTWLLNTVGLLKRYFWVEGNSSYCLNEEEHGKCHLDLLEGCYKVTGEYSGTIEFFGEIHDKWTGEFSISNDGNNLTLEDFLYGTLQYQKIEECPNTISKSNPCPKPY
ncbi:MAG: hypothetical protein AB1668_07525 [Nanoarchaeota archaeon]